MGYPVQAGAPTTTVQGRKLAVGAFPWDTPVGAMFKVGVYEQMPNGEWNELFAAATYANAGDVLADLKQKGGGVKYIQWLIAQINAFFAKLFGAAPPAPTTEPTTDAQAKAFVTGGVNALTLTLVDGVPLLG